MALLAAPRASDQLKPAPWNAGPGLVAPEYDHFWNGLYFALPLWEGNVRPYDIVSGLTPDNVSGSPITDATDLGPAVGTDSDNDAIEFDSLVIPTGDFSMGVLIKRTGVVSSNGRIFHGSVSANDFTLRNDGSTIELHLTGISTNLDFGDDGSICMPLDEWRLICVSHESGRQEVRSIALDGSVSATVTATNTGNYTGGNGIDFGSNGSQDIPHNLAVVYMWEDRFLELDEWLQLAVDPFGMFRPNWGYLAQAGSLASLYANADGTINNLVNEVDATSPLWSSIDDDPDSPTDADWVNNAVSVTGAQQGFFDLTATPGDFGTADSAEIEVRVKTQDVSGTLRLMARLYESDESTPLSDEVEAVAISVDGAFTNYTATFTGLNTTADKTTWDAARIRFRWATGRGFSSGFDSGFG